MSTPSFQSGDKVRVIRHEAMVADGLADRQGEVYLVQYDREGMQVCRVRFADQSCHTIRAEHLSKELLDDHSN